jgi:thymidine kinase
MPHRLQLCIPSWSIGIAIKPYTAADGIQLMVGIVEYSRSIEQMKPRPVVDVRYDDNLVTSHDQNQIPSTPVPAAANIGILASGCDVVGIDEAQFFDDEIVQVCNDLANRGIRVIVAGLDMDYKGNPFGPMPALMATAEYVTKVHAVCTRTGNLAQYSFRKSASEDLLLLGEKETYEPLSRAAFFKAQKALRAEQHPPKSKRSKE